MRLRPVFNFARLSPPDARDDLRRQLLASTDHSVGKRREGFETRRKMRAEKAHRARSLERLAQGRWGQQSALRKQREAARLSKLLRQAKRAKDLPSFANPLFMRELRRRLFGEILRLIRGIPAQSVRIYTIAAAKWNRPASQLQSLSPAKLRESLRTLLIKAGLNDLPGWTIVFFHNEYDRATDNYQPHFHIIVIGEKYRAFEVFRDFKMFKGGKGKPIYRPVVLDQLVNPARQISYLLKGYWPDKKSYPRSTATGSRWRRRPRRIPEPRHAESILFLHRQRFSDLVWMHNIEIKNRRLVPGGCQ